MDRSSFQIFARDPGRSVTHGRRWGYPLLLVILAGCTASPFSGPLRQVAKTQPAFAEVAARPESFKGRPVLLGGTIVQTSHQPNVTEIEVVQKPLDSYNDRPEDTDQSFGRFLARCPGFLDSALYTKGREISVAGEIQGREARPLDQTEYSYPVVSCKKVQLWPNRSQTTYGYPYPYYGYGWPGYPYWGGRYWYPGWWW